MNYLSTAAKRSISLTLIGLVGWSCSGRQPPQFDGLDEFLDSLRVEHNVPGLSFAAFDDGDVLFQHVSGYKDQDTKELVDAQTAFEAASISKPVFGYIVLSLVRDGVLGLDTPLSELSAVLPEIAYDPRSAMLTPRLLLAHMGGLPNWRSRLNFEATTHDELFAADDTLRFVMDPDTEYRYSGEGYVLLQRIVEETTGEGLNALARRFVFDPLEMARSSFEYDDHIRTNTSKGHNTDLKPDKWEISVALASTTLHTTASDLAAFGVHLASGMGEGSYYAPMAESAVTRGSRDGFEYQWGLGLGIVRDELGTYVYHGGNNVIFIADFVYGLEENLGYALLTNGASGSAIIESVRRRVFGRDVPR